ncbi:hypothetical protein SKDZ_10G0370 [Saccharomyces kudriavzevii ZP591]|nr:hypothetical protein SKDZ_10G0370 [Saccharomyces kudriavzevii ZP591]
MKVFKDEEERTFSNLKAIICACQTYSPVPHHLQETKAKIISAAKLIIDTYFSSFTTIDEISDIRTYLFVWLRDLGMLDLYQTVLLESISLMFDLTTSNFRNWTVEDSFPHLIVHLYTRIKSYQVLLNDSVLSEFFANFDHTFRTAYNLANCAVYEYDDVHYISDDAYSLVASVKIDPAQIIKREYFRLSIQKLNVSDVLIEIFHLLDGLAIFKVNSCSLSKFTGSVETVFRSISEGNYEILELGRSLMFPLLRVGDFKICKINDRGAVISFTKANDVKLEIFSLDEASWITQWKRCFQNHVKGAVKDSSFTKTVSKNFKSLDKCNTGLGLIVEENILPEDSTLVSTEQRSPPPSNNGCLLHRSKPLQIPLSSVVRDDFGDDYVSLDENNSHESYSGPESIIPDYGFHGSTFSGNDSLSYSSKTIHKNSMQVKITDENTILSVNNTQISRWSDNSWQSISPDQLNIAIIRLHMGYFLVAYDPDHKDLDQFSIRLCDDIKCMQSSEQDIQLRIPFNTLMCNVTGILNIRLEDVDKLLLVLNFYTMDHSEAMSHSSTMDSISSALSSVSSAIDFKHPLLKCSSVIIPHELTPAVTDSTSD